MRCKHCGAAGSHFCDTLGRELDGELDIDQFLISAAIGALTGSTLLGGLLGGSFIGGAAGDLLEGGGILDDE